MRYFACFLLLLPILLKAQDLPVYDTPTVKDPKEIISFQIKSLDHLMNLTEATLHTLNSLRKDILNYETVQNLYLDHPNDKELLYKMTKMAYEILDEIKSTNLTHAFDPEFLSELTMLGKIYQKYQIPRL